MKYWILLILAFVSILPFYWMFTATLKTSEELMRGTYIQWLPSSPNWQNFIKAWNYLQLPPLWRAFLNSAVVTISAVVLQIFGCALVGYVLAKYEFRGNRAVFSWILVQLMIPSVTSLLPSYLLMTWLGWMNTYWSLIIPGVFSAYTIFLMRQYIITIPDDILDAARLSGCSEIGIFWRMVLPLSKPALAAVGLVNSVWVWNDFLWPSLMIKNTDMYTVQLALAGLWDIRSSFPSLPLVAGCITMATIPLIVLTIITQKYLIKGWTGLSYAKR